MARFVFTEINGVLIPEASKFTAILLNEEVRAFKPSVTALNRIIDATHAQLVVASSWRAMGIGLLQDKFKQIGITAKIADVTPGDAHKDVALHHFLKGAPEWGYSKVESFVVLDNEQVYSADIAPFLILAEQRAGLTSALADKAIAILNNQEYSP